MISNTFPDRLSLPRIFWFGVIGLASVIAGYAVAANTMMLFLAICWLVWLATLPYHATISISVAVATFTSAFIVPYFPGRPYFWEFAALLGWSGLLVTVSMRQYRAEFMQLIRQNRWLFAGAVGYCAVLLVIMYYRGFGLRIFGGEQMG